MNPPIQVPNPPAREITFQKGPQEQFLSSRASIVVFGGGAGGGKTYSLLLEILRHIKNSKFRAIVFRRNSTMIRNPGGLWDSSTGLFHPLGAEPKQSFLEWTFRSGATVKFAHLENEDTVLSYQGAQIPLIMFDELTHFTEKQFWYLLSRLRSESGVPGYIRATCNPDPEGFTRKLIDWWIGEDGLPIKERSGVVRWFIRQDDDIIWADSAKELIDKYGYSQIPKSFTFIPSLIYDNKILMEKDPGYLSNLMALSRIDRLRLLGGNWDVKPTAGMFFRREWFEILDAMPTNITRIVRAWDKAATMVTAESPNPDWTRGVKMAQLTDGKFIVMDVASLRGTPGQVETFVKNVTSQDGHDVTVSLAQDPGSAGVSERDAFVRLLAGYAIAVNKPSANKITRAKPLSAQCEFGNVKLLRGDWNEEFLLETENFDGEEKNKDDQVDAASDAFNELCGMHSAFDAY